MEILTKDDGTTIENGKSPAHATNDEHNEIAALSSLTTSHLDYTSSRNAHYNTRNGDFRNRDNVDFYSQNMNDGYSFSPNGREGSFCGEENGNNDIHARLRRPQYEKVAKRTVLLYNLPEGATHEDITNVVRGGMLLDVYLRTHDRAASVSFLEAANAQAFYRHIKRYDLYIRGKRVRVSFSMA